MAAVDAKEKHNYNVIRLEKNGTDKNFQACMQGGKLSVTEISN